LSRRVTDCHMTTTPSRIGIRDEQTELTRARILDAIVRITARDVVDLTVEAVAREAGVSRPTVYRYFANKREMVDAVGQLYAERLGTAPTMTAASLDEVLDAVPAIFARWAQLEPALRAAAASTRGEEERKRFLPERVAAVERLLEPYSGDLTPGDRKRLVRIAILFMSSGMAELMQRYFETTSDEAADLVVWGVRRLVGEPKEGEQ